MAPAMPQGAPGPEPAPSVAPGPAARPEGLPEPAQGPDKAFLEELREKMGALLARHPDVRARLAELLAPASAEVSTLRDELLALELPEARRASSTLPHCWVRADGSRAGWPAFDPGCLTCHARAAKALGLLEPLETSDGPR